MIGAGINRGAVTREAYRSILFLPARTAVLRIVILFHIVTNKKPSEFCRTRKRLLTTNENTRRNYSGRSSMDGSRRELKKTYKSGGGSVEGGRPFGCSRRDVASGISGLVGSLSWSSSLGSRANENRLCPLATKQCCYTRARNTPSWRAGRRSKVDARHWRERKGGEGAGQRHAL